MAAVADGPTRLLSCQMRHTIAAIKAAWYRSALSLLSACVRLRQLRQVHHNLQQALSPCSRTQSSATDGSPASCTSLMLRLCVMLRVPSPYSVRSLLVLLLCKQRCSSCCLARSCLGHYIGSCRGVLPRTNARCVVGQ